MFHQPAGPASAVTSHCSSSRAPLDDSGNSLLTRDEPSFLMATAQKCVYVSAFVYVFVCVRLGGVFAGWVVMGYSEGGEGLLEGVGGLMEV